MVGGEETLKISEKMLLKVVHYSAAICEARMVL